MKTMRQAVNVGDIVRLTLPASEVCMHLKEDGKRRWVLVLPDGAQILDDKLRHVSIAINHGEAGIFRDGRDDVLYVWDLPFLRTRVQRGAALLDAKAPEWFRNVDLETLHMGNASWCVLGQTFLPQWNDQERHTGNPYFLGTGVLGLEGPADEVQHGFAAYMSDGFYGNGEWEFEIGQLNELWKTLVWDRRAAASQAANKPTWSTEAIAMQLGEEGGGDNVDR